MSVAEYHEIAAAVRETHPDLPDGIIVGGPLVRAKQLESCILFGVFVTGSIAGLIWAFTQGVGRVEWSLFALMYALTTIGIGLTVHRMLVHRSFKCNAAVKYVLSARWHVRDRF
jgi:stearoyl-CoA desaturase (Delta-9 desaturase)